MPISGLRVVTFNVLPIAYQMIAGWAAPAGNKLVLVVTTPGPSTRRTPSYRGGVESAPPGQGVWVIATPLAEA